jgi:heptose-I-phosphate ethanolaminephosphotransferase
LDAIGGDTLTYISDHGEGLGEGGGLVDHINGPAPRQVYEVPLIFHIGDRFAQDFPSLLERMAVSLDRPFQSDHLIHTLLDLYAIRASELRPDWSLFSSRFRPTPRFCDQLARAGG